MSPYYDALIFYYIVSYYIFQSLFSPLSCVQFVRFQDPKFSSIIYWSAYSLVRIMAAVLVRRGNLTSICLFNLPILRRGYWFRSCVESNKAAIFKADPFRKFLKTVRFSSSLAMSSLDLSGIFPPIVTPFGDNEGVNHDKLKYNFSKWNEIPFSGKRVFSLISRDKEL